MAYVAPGAMTFRRTGGDLDKKITDQLALIDTEIDAAEARVTSLEGSRVKYAIVPFTAGNANAFALAWRNPGATDLLIIKMIISIGTAGGTAGAVLDVGTGATATTHSDNLLDGLDANATGLFDNITNKGDNGKTTAALAIGQYITAQILTQNAASLVGAAIIIYM